MENSSDDPKLEESKKETSKEQPVISPVVPNLPQSKLPLVLIIIFLLFLFGFGGFLLGKSLSVSQNISPTPTPGTKPTVIPTKKPDITTDWKTYTSTTLGFTFKYPTEYNPPEERENYLSLISPLNTNKGKGFELQNGELKIEIITEVSKEKDSATKCWDDHATLGLGKIINQSEIIINGIDTMIINWEGMGSGQFICIIYNKQRYLINKYPLETTRQTEFDQILSTFKFLSGSGTELISCETSQDCTSLSCPESQDPLCDNYPSCFVNKCQCLLVCQ